MNENLPQFEIKAEMLVADVLKTWPQTIAVFLHHQTACVGCSMAPFETLLDVSKNYQIMIETLLGELQQSICSQP
jgi:hybrid cluster-associated redox disulfide protein